MRGLIISIDDSEAVSLEQIRAFLAGSVGLRFGGHGRADMYTWAEGTLVQHEYAGLNRTGKGLLRLYVARDLTPKCNFGFCRAIDHRERFCAL